MRVTVSSSRVPIVFAQSVKPSVVRTPGTFSIGSLRDVQLSANVQEGDGLFYSSISEKWTSQPVSNAISNALVTINIFDGAIADGGTY